LSPDAPAGLTVKTPVSLRDLPATVVDQLELSADSPFPGHSLAKLWSPTSSESAPPTTSPAFTELVGSIHEYERHDRPSRRNLQMSVMKPGWHYLRDAAGREQIYDLTQDMGELQNLENTANGKNQRTNLQGMLLDVLTKNPGSTEVEDAYLTRYRQELKGLVQPGSPTPEATTPSSAAP
jgi:arylsulfatase A-like enzyme